MSQNTTLSSSLQRALIFKTPSEALPSVLICTIARSSFLTWLRSQILNTLHLISVVLQNICLLALCPLIFFIVLSAESHITSIHLSQTLGDLCENALFIYLQFGITLICLVYGSRFSFGWQQQSPVLRHFQMNMMKCFKLLACSYFSFTPMQDKSAKKHFSFSPNMWDFPGIDFQTVIYSCDYSCNSRPVRLLFI